MKKLILFLIILICSSSYCQEVEEMSSKQVVENSIYTSIIREDTGKPLDGITVRVRGTGETAITDFNGEFSVRAKPGDVLIISKDGKRINTITLNNSNFYKITNKPESIKSEKVISKKSSVNSVQNLLNSAKLYQKKDSDKSINFVEKALKNIGSSGDKTMLSEAYTILGDIYFHIKQYDLAVTNYEFALNFKNQNTIKFKLAKAYTLNGNFVESTEMYNELLKEKTSTNQKIVLFEGLGDNASRKLDKLDEAIENYNMGLEIATKNKILPKISELNSKIGETYSQKGETQKAEDYFNNTLELAEKEENIESRARSKNSIADYYKDQKKYGQEIELRKETLEELDNISTVNDAITFDKDESEITSQRLNLDIGAAYFNKGDLKEAIPYLEKSIEKANLVKDLETQKDALQRLSELYRSVGKSEKALEKYQEYAQLVDAIYKQKEREIEEAITLGKELTNKQNRINSLEKDRELSESRYSLFNSQKELTRESYRRQQLIIYCLLGGLLLLLFSVFWMYKGNKQKRLANNLLALKSLRSQMNPHFIFNALNSVNNYISQNDERAANRYLTEFSKLMRSVLDNSEQDFISLSKEIELLELYIKLEHSRFTDKFDYKLIIDEKLQISEFQIPPMLLQPYVENAVWHGLRYKKEKGKLEVQILQKDNETVEISVIDDGIGRKKSKELKTENQQKQQSKGMNNIKKRIAILNEMYSEKVAVFIDDLLDDNSGTKVVLTLKKN